MSLWSFKAERKAEEHRKPFLGPHRKQSANVPCTAHVWKSATLACIWLPPITIEWPIAIAFRIPAGFHDMFAWAANPALSEYVGPHIVAGHSCDLWRFRFGSLLLDFRPSCAWISSHCRNVLAP